MPLFFIEWKIGRRNENCIESEDKWNNINLNVTAATRSGPDLRYQKEKCQNQQQNKRFRNVA